jgi:hypothetical protein
MNLCDQCETFSHCSRHGCIPLQPAPPSAAQAGAQARRWCWRLALLLAVVLAAAVSGRL